MSLVYSLLFLSKYLEPFSLDFYLTRSSFLAIQKRLKEVGSLFGFRFKTIINPALLQNPLKEKEGYSCLVSLIHEVPHR